MWPLRLPLVLGVPSGRGPPPALPTLLTHLCQEFVDRVLILGELPGLSQPAVTDMAHEHSLVVEGSSLTLGTRHIDRDGMLIIGDDVVELDPEGAAGDPHRPGEEVEDRIHALVVTGNGIAARRGSL